MEYYQWRFQVALSQERNPYKKPTLVMNIAWVEVDAI